MARDIEALTLQMSADLRRFEKSMDGMRAVADRRLSQVEQRATQADKNLARIMERAGKNATKGLQDGLSGIAPVLAAAFSVDAVIKYADGYTQLENRLKAAGLAGEGLKSTENDLYDIANRNGLQVAATAELYQRASLSRKRLGASEADLKTLVSGTAAALKVQGTSAEAASGPLLQLGQLLSGNNVQAQEYNSLIDGLPVVLQAAANGSKRFGGDIATLTTLVKAGKVSSKEFFEALLAGFPSIEAQATGATHTISGALTVLNNELGRYVGQSDKSLSVTSQMAQAIELLAKNLDVVVGVGGVLVTLVGTRAVVAFTASTVATLRDVAAKEVATVQAAAYTAALAGNVGMLNASAAATAAATLSTTGFSGAARVAGSALLGAFGGPIGLAVTALAAGIGAIAISSYHADQQTRALKQSVDDTTKSIDREKTAAAILAQEQGKSVAPFGQAEIATASLTGEVNKLGDAHYRAANAAKQQRIEEAQTAADSAKRASDEAALLVKRDRENRIRGAVTGGGINAGTGGGGSFLTPGEISRLEAQSLGSDAAKTAAQAKANADYRQAELDRIKKEGLANFLPPKPPAATGTGTGSGANETDQIVSQIQKLYDDGLTATEKAQQQYRADVDVLNEAFAKGLITDLQRQIIQARLDVNLDQLLNPISDVKTPELGDTKDRGIQDTTDGMKAVNLALTDQEKLYNNVADAAEYSFARAKGSLADFASYFSQELEAMAAEWAASKLGELIFGARDSHGDRSGGFLDSLSGKRAAGGPVSAGGAYLVGEKRPEIFVPNTAGRIIPNTSALNKVGSRGGGSNNINVHMSYQIAGAIDRDQIAAAIRRENLATGSKVTAEIKKNFGSMLAYHSKYEAKA